MPLVDVTITAVKRPKLLERTLESFWDKCFGLSHNQFRAVINVDPVGEPGAAEETVDVCREYFKEVIWRCPKVASFGHAFVWVWSKAVTPFIFHLEDDWELTRTIDFDRMIAIMENNTNLALLRLPAFPTAAETAKQWNVFYPWNGTFFECPIEQRAATGFAGHPSLIRTLFARQALLFLEVGKNPEKQFHYRSDLKDLALKWRFGVYSNQSSPAAIVDIGRDWIKDQPWKKAGDKSFFTHWEAR